MQTNTPGSLKEKFGNFGAAPTEQLWDSISSSLDQKEKKRRGIFWWWFAGIAASGLLLFGIYYLGYQVGKNEKNLVEESSNPLERSDVNLTRSLPSVEMTGGANYDLEEELNVNTNGSLPSGEIAASKEDDLEKESNANSSGFRNNPDSYRDGMTDSKNDDLEKGSDVNSTGSLHAVQMTGSSENNLVMISTEKMTRFDSPAIDKIPQRHEENFDEYAAPAFEKSKPKNNWELGISVGTQSTFSSKEEALYLNPPNNFTADLLSTENTIQGTGSVYNSLSAPVSGSITRPLSIDLSIARTFGPRWTLQSGLGINWMKSVTHYNSVELSRIDASFFSITVPVIAEFDFVKRKRFEFSTGFGIVNELPVFSRSTSVNPILESATVSKSFINGYMCSGLLNLGMSYHLTENLKIALQPNLRRYFFQSMKSDYPVLEKKTWFGANVGLVWEI